MNALAAVANLFRPKPSEPLQHVQIRYVVPLGNERTQAKRREANLRASVNGQLAVYAAVTTPAQRRAEATAFHDQFMKDWPALRAGRGRGE